LIRINWAINKVRKYLNTKKKLEVVKMGGIENKKAPLKGA